VADEYYLFSSDGYSLAAGYSLLWQQSADDVTNGNLGFKQFMTAVSI